jgi:GT2 family glycosyltransferase
MLKVAVVILNWNGESFLRKFLPNVVNNTMEEGIEVIIADNGSTDGSVSFLEDCFPTIRVIKFSKNHGYASGYNLALKQIESEYYVLLNSDVDVPQGWLDPLISFMESNQNAAACMPKILDYLNPSHFEYAGSAGGFIDYFGYPYCRGRVLSSIEEDKGQYDQPIEVFWASGACLLIRAKVFWDAEGLDGDFFAHMEEIDLCWRLHNLGYSTWCIPDSKVYHVGGGTLPNNNPRKLYYNYRNSLYMLYKNLPKRRLILVLFIRLVLDGLSAFAYLLQGKFSFFNAVFMAHCTFWNNIGSLRDKRKKLKAKNIKNKSKTFRRSILVDFFLFKKKTFSSL